MSSHPRAVIFDLDGVLVDTAQFHLAAWRRIAAEFGFDFDDSVGESLKGVGRDAALRLVAQAGGIELSAVDQRATADRKNAYYNEHLHGLGEAALLPGAAEALAWLRARGFPIGLASASKNARTILRSTGIEPLFDVIVDGLSVTRAKPDPTVFLAAAEGLGIPAPECVVFEDAVAGVQGAMRAGCRVVGVGDPFVLRQAESVVSTLAELDWVQLMGRS